MQRLGLPLRLFVARRQATEAPVVTVICKAF